MLYVNYLSKKNNYLKRKCFLKKLFVNYFQNFNSNKAIVMWYCFLFIFIINFIAFF